MSLNTISTEFEAAFNAQKSFRPIAAPDRPLREHAHTIYPLQCIPELSKQVKMRAKKDVPYDCLHDEFLSEFAARFVVTTNGLILFSFEGPRSSKTTANSDIPLTVLTAGNIYF